MRRAEGKVRALLTEGWSLLNRGRAREAADVFGRVALLDAGRDEAREGLTQARAAAAEQDRRVEAGLDEARAAVDAGDAVRARALIEDVLRRGGERDSALALLDRLDGRSGRLGAPAPAPEAADVPVPAPRTSRPSRSRRWVVAAWGVMFGLLAAGAALSWESLLDRLVRTPSPTKSLVLPSTLDAQASPGEPVLAEVRRLLDQGELEAALSSLEGIALEDPAYPFARRLRVQVEAALSHRARGR